MGNRIINDIEKYYSDKVIKFGATPEGVDWNGFESQNIRFEQLGKIFDKEIVALNHFSILDYGCGYGSLFSYLKNLKSNFSYFGFDISTDMLKQAQIIFPNEGSWLNSLPPNFKVDYVVASGLFNVKLNQSLVEWEEYILTTLNKINSICTKGFSFNILTSYSDLEYMKEYLYYASPEFFFNHCKINYSKQVAILHDYNLYEFTILVRK